MNIFGLQHFKVWWTHCCANVIGFVVNWYCSWCMPQWISFSHNLSNYWNNFDLFVVLLFLGRSLNPKKADGIKESTDSSNTTIEDEDAKSRKWWFYAGLENRTWRCQIFYLHLIDVTVWYFKISFSVFEFQSNVVGIFLAVRLINMEPTRTQPEGIAFYSVRILGLKL